MIKDKTVVRSYGEGHSKVLTIPTYVAQDSQFPFKDGEVVWIRIEDQRLVIERVG